MQKFLRIMKLIYYFLPQYITNLIYHQSIVWSNRWQYYKSVLYLSRSHILFFSEKGKFLALDLGGTNFRVLIVELNGRDVDIQSKTYLIPQRIMLGTGTQVCKAKTLLSLYISSSHYPLAILLSHPAQPVDAPHQSYLYTTGFPCVNKIFITIIKKHICHTCKHICHTCRHICHSCKHICHM
jgi:hypothetical protein